MKGLRAWSVRLMQFKSTCYLSSQELFGVSKSPSRWPSLKISQPRRTMTISCLYRKLSYIVRESHQLEQQIILLDSNGGPSDCRGCAQPNRPAEKNGGRQISPLGSLLPLLEALPPTPRRSARTSIVPDASEKGECSGSPSPGSSKRKRGDSDSAPSTASKVRRVSETSNVSLAARSSNSPEVKPDRKCKKSKGRKGVKASHPKKAVSIVVDPVNELES